MLSHAELMTLEQKLREQTVLSIYVNGDFADVAARNQWRTQVRNALDAIEESLKGSTHADRESFASARKLAMTEIDSYKSGEDAPGWMGLFTATETHLAAVVPVSVPTTASWSQGANVAPAIRVLKESRPVLVVVADGTNIRINRYVDRTMALEESIDRVAKVDEPDHLSKPLPQGFHSGAGGIPGTDMMLTQAAGRINQLAGEDAWILIGGIDVVAAALHSRLEKRLERRAAIVPLDIHDNQARLAEIAREHVSRLRAEEDLKRVNEVLSASAAGGTGAVGLKEIDRALFNGQVHELFLTSSFVNERPEESEVAIRRAYDVSATVEHVSGDAAERLDAAGGIAARLRFTIQPASETTV
jgi:hypothetical protein